MWLKFSTLGEGAHAVEKWSYNLVYQSKQRPVQATDFITNPPSLGALELIIVRSIVNLDNISLGNFYYLLLLCHSSVDLFSTPWKRGQSLEVPVHQQCLEVRRSKTVLSPKDPQSRWEYEPLIYKTMNIVLVISSMLVTSLLLWERV